MQENTYGILVQVVITKNGEFFYRGLSESTGLKKEELYEMEQDLENVRDKWKKASGLGS